MVSITIEPSTSATIEMRRFFFHHWTATLLAALAAGWSLFYLPSTPSFAILQLKRAIDARDADRAAQFVDFESVVKHAGYEMIQEKGGAGDVLGQLLGKGAVELLSKPAAGFVESWVKREVSEGAKEVQMPGGAVAASVFLLHRDGNTAYTNFKDPKGRTWEIHMAQLPGGQWQVVEVKNIGQLLDQLKRNEEKHLAAPH